MRMPCLAGLAVLYSCLGGPEAGEAVAPQPASQPVVKEGLSISVRPSKATFARREPITLHVTLTNVSKRQIGLAGTRFRDWRPSPGLTFLVTDVNSKKVRTLREGMDPRIMAPVRLQDRALRPDEAATMVATLDQWAWSQAPGARGGRRFLGPALLPGGACRITVRCLVGKGFRQSPEAWSGEIEASPVSVAVAEGEAAPEDPALGRAGPPASKWITLFAAERWYRNQKGQERLFTGVPTAVANAGGASTLQRGAHYTLGEWRLHTGARRHPELDRLVGEPVQIRGKAVEMNLEGQHLREIWPGAVRQILPVAPSPLQPGAP